MTPTGDDDWWARPRTQLLLLVATVVVLVLTTAVIATQGEPEQNTLEYDARTYAIQFLLLTGLGAVVAFLVDLEKRTRETRQQRRKFETETVSDALEQLDRIYAEVKNVRRMLRVDAALGELDARRLREHMSSLNQDQTSVEQLRKRLEALDSKVPGLAVIAVHLEGFDKYLSRYWDAFEKSPVPGPWLDGFVAKAHSDGSDFKTEFEKYYDDARAGLIPLLGTVSTKAR